jgi:flagellar protein FlaJ
MPKTIPFVILPLPLMKRVIAPLLGFGYRIAMVFPYLELELMQADIDLEPEEYTSIMIFNFVAYFALFAGLSSLLLRNFITAKQELLGISIPEFVLLSLTIGLIGAFLVFIQMSMYPKIRIKKKVREIESNLIYALRTMLVQIKSGISLFDSLNMIAMGKYGQLSSEIKEAIDEINTGVSEKAALEKIATKNPSPYLRKVIWQIVNGMKAGADISAVLSESVASMTREQKIEIQRYGSDLRVLSLIYLMIGIIIPALGLTFLIVLGSFPRIEITETTFWALLGFVIIAEFMYLGIIKSKRPTLMSA